jgi:hypothetical protein
MMRSSLACEKHVDDQLEGILSINEAKCLILSKYKNSRGSFSDLIHPQHNTDFAILST